MRPEGSLRKATNGSDNRTNRAVARNGSRASRPRNRSRAVAAARNQRFNWLRAFSIYASMRPEGSLRKATNGSDNRTNRAVARNGSRASRPRNRSRAVAAARNQRFNWLRAFSIYASMRPEGSLRKATNGSDNRTNRAVARNGSRASRPRKRSRAVAAALIFKKYFFLKSKRAARGNPLKNGVRSTIVISILT